MKIQYSFFGSISQTQRTKRFVIKHNLMIFHFILALTQNNNYKVHLNVA